MVKGAYEETQCDDVLADKTAAANAKTLPQTFSVSKAVNRSQDAAQRNTTLFCYSTTVHPGKGRPQSSTATFATMERTNAQTGEYIYIYS